MSAFNQSENLFEHYDMNEYIGDAFPQDSFLASKSMHTQVYPQSSTSPSISYSESLQPSMSTMSHASVTSGTSTASSATGSPFLTMHQDSEPPFDDWSKDRWDLGVEPNIMAPDDGYLPHTQADEYQGQMSFVQPGLVSNYPYFQPDPSPFDDHASDFQPQPSSVFHLPSPVPTSGSSTRLASTAHATSNKAASRTGTSRRPSVGSVDSGSAYSKGSPVATPGVDEEGSDRGRCPYPGCGRVFKDLRAHKLTHQSERPEKCPIEKCQYHTKGFARKYDQTRHTLTHYKGTMVCGFCPGSGSATEKSFNRADVFKRHLTSVHGVEQQPSNSRRKTPVVTKKMTSSKDENKEGKCSTCGSVFMSAQEFYNHLDDCVMKVLEKPDVSEVHNERHLTEISNDQAVRATLERNNLPTEIEDQMVQTWDEDDEEMEDDDDSSDTKGHAASNRIGKPGRGMTRSKGGVPTVTKGRRKRKDYPHSWGCSKEQMKMKKRVLCVFEGQRRLWKDEMMMDNDYEVRVPLGDNKYVTDLDILTLRKAQGLHEATDQEKGPWLDDEEVTKLML